MKIDTGAQPLAVPPPPTGSGWMEVVAHAADIIEIEAQCLQEGHTVDGDWDTANEPDAKGLFVDMMYTVHGLRALLPNVELTRGADNNQPKQ